MHLTALHFPTLPRRVLTLALGVLVLLGVAAAPVAAVEPLDARDPKPTAPAPPPPAPSVAPTPAPAPGPVGFDISWPQCERTLPVPLAFSVVGVNGGRVHSPNPCLVAAGGTGQLEWAGQSVELYANTGNPGPELSSFWPHGQTTPRECNTATTPGADTADCAYVYGWNAAADSYKRALDAFIELGWAAPDATRVPGERTWWLDVETANSWRGDRSLNVAALQGAVDYLESVSAEVGFYSTPLLWWEVTGSTKAFAEYPSWHAGARDRADAEDRCDEEAFTGGELRMVQWVENDLDLNYRCP